MKLWSELRQPFIDALFDAFNLRDLEQMLRFKCKRRLDGIKLIGNKDALPHVIEAVVDDAERGGWLSVLADGAVEVRGTHQQLTEVVKWLRLGIEREGKAYYQRGLQPRKTDSLIRAAKLLSQLPTEHVPEVAAFPAFSRINFSPNQHFVGRQEELKQLATALKQPDGNVAVGQAAVSGIGGIGKTQLAVEFAHRYGHYFAGGVFWLNCSEPKRIASEFAACGGAVHHPNFEALNEPARLRLVTQAFQEPMPRLLVFDNLDDKDALRLLQRWRPKTGGCRVLVTSRRDVWRSSVGVRQLRLDTLPAADSRALLQQLAPRLGDAEADQVAERLGNFPLALYLAGSFLGSNTRTVERFLARYEAKKLAHPAMLGKGADAFSPTEHDLTVYGTFAVSWEQLEPSPPAPLPQGSRADR